MTIRPTFLLLIAILFIVTLVSAQNTTSTLTSVTLPEEAVLKLYSDISSPLNEAKASFRSASSTDKSNLWRAHLALFLAKRQELNQQQKKVILAAMSLATPEFFEVRSSDPAWKVKVGAPLRSLEEQIVSAFPMNDATMIFATLQDGPGFVKCSSASAGSALVPLSNHGGKLQSIPGLLVSQQEMTRDKSPCTCSTKSDWCPISGYCAVTDCARTDSGCGTLWTYPCDGTCK